MILYRDVSGLKYQLAARTRQATGIAIPSPAVSACGLLHLGRGGVLTVRAGYLWDGPSGPAFDTSSAMRGSLVHDALYQLIREGALPPSWRMRADKVLWLICLEDGMDRNRADRFRSAVRLFGGWFATPGEPRLPILTAP